MEYGSLLAPQSPLHIVAVRITPEGVTLIAEPAAGFACCPECGQRSTRVHSHYSRTLQDLPAHGRVVHLELRLRRFFCDLSDCPRRTFSEPPSVMAAPHARKTSRLVQSLRETAFTAGGEAGARLAGELGMPTSADTLLRLIRGADSGASDTATAACPPTLRVLGVDDWALRRGQVYGTILCNLESHEPIDLLPERSADTFAAWLKEHPGIEIISRDRGGEYAKGATLGAPDAIQVADRWHLLHNLTDALQRAVDHHQPLLAEVAKEVAAVMAVAPPAVQALASESASPPPLATLSRAEQSKQDSRARRKAQFEQVLELQRQGVSLREIGRQLNVSRNTVRRFVQNEQFPERATPTRRPILLDEYLPYLKQLWEEGCDNVQTLFQKIKAKGFSGSIHMVRLQVRRWRRAAGTCSATGPRPAPRPPRIIRPSARRIAWLALGHVAQPTAHDHAIIEALLRRWPELQETAELARQFAAIFKEHDADSLEAWVQLAKGPLILPEVRRFAEMLRQDWAAVVEAARQPWSQGQVEGQVNRLKSIKHQMYGRANFDLLRQRVLHAPPGHAKTA
jgi:transposase